MEEKIEKKWLYHLEHGGKIFQGAEITEKLLMDWWHYHEYIEKLNTKPSMKEERKDAPKRLKKTKKVK